MPDLVPLVSVQIAYKLNGVPEKLLYVSPDVKDDVVDVLDVAHA